MCVITCIELPTTFARQLWCTLYIRSHPWIYLVRSRDGKGKDGVHVANNRYDKRLGDLLPNGMRRAAQGVSHGRRKGEEGGEKKYSLSSKHRGRQMRRTRDRIVRGVHGCTRTVSCVRATHSRSERDRTKRGRMGDRRGMGFGERNFEISTNGRRYAEPRLLRGRVVRVARVSTRKQKRSGLIPGTYRIRGLPSFSPLRNDEERRNFLFRDFRRQRGARSRDARSSARMFYLVRGSRIANDQRWDSIQDPHLREKK